jgi:thioesterase domain-containing protein
LLALRVTAQIRRRFGRDLPVAALFQGATVERLAALLRRGPAGLPHGDPLVEIQPLGDLPPLFFVHPIGGGVLCYAELARRLGPRQPFFGLQAPELAGGGGSARFSSIEERAAAYIDSLRGLQPAGPYRLGGWSMGAVIAFEMAQQLTRAGEAVELVALLDAACPVGEPGGDEGPEALAAWFARDLAGRAGLDPAALPPSLPPAGRDPLDALLEWARAAGALPAGVERSEVAGLFGLFQSNLAALRRYAPQPYPGRLLLVRAAERPDRDPTLGWGAVAAGGLDAWELPGDHYTLLQVPRAAEVAALLAGALAAPLTDPELIDHAR